jgi:hypothetical protein
MNRIIALLVVAVAVACNDGRPVGPDSPALAASRAGVPFTERLVSPEWQATAASLAAQARISPPAGARALSLLGVAQYLAVQEAVRTPTARPLASGSAPAAGAASRPIAGPSQARPPSC